ncbi:MAG: hypothetical protein PHT02_04340 [Tissierellia bacterium]|nr:hypothetical protein [Tissierellia bacterium]
MSDIKATGCGHFDDCGCDNNLWFWIILIIIFFCFCGGFDNFFGRGCCR